MNIQYGFTLLAQQVENSAQETAADAQDLISKITLEKVTRAFLIVLSVYLILKCIDHVINWLSEKIAKEWRLKVKQFLPFLRTFVLSTAAIILMNLFLDLSQENLLAITGTIAVALGFAFKDYISSIIAGIVGLFESTYNVGDRVTIGDYYGEVLSYDLRAVRIRTPEDSIITIPHNKIWTEAISNANTGALEAQVVTKFYFAHEVDVILVKKILYRIAQTSKYTSLKLPIVVVMEEKSWGTIFKLKCYPLDARDEFIYQTDLISRAKRTFAKYDLPYPKIFDIEDIGAEASDTEPKG